MVAKNNFEWKKYLIECMKSTEYCCLGTVDNIDVWTNPVYFSWDDDFNIYFISQPHSRHMKSIKGNPKISLSIYNTGQSTFGDVAGIQLEGLAVILNEKGEVDKAYSSYYGRKYPDTGRDKSGKDEDNYINNPEWLFVKVTPKHLYYFDTRFFDEVRQEVPLGKLK